MSTFSAAAKNGMLDSRTLNQLRLHTGDPGAAGTANQYGHANYSHQAASFAAASNAERALSGDVTFNGGPTESATWASVWDSGGSVFQAKFELQGDTTFNASGELTIKASTTRLILEDSA